MAGQEEDVYYDGQKIYYNLEELERSLAQEVDNYYGEEDDPDVGSGPLVQDYNVIAPPEHEWYHGVLDRKTAEERLRRFNKAGAYLVRESERKAGSYSLSFLGLNGFSHFRITSILGHYYIGGRQFPSLSNLIGYYTNVSRLLENEFLTHPVPPLEPVHGRRRRVIAIYPCPNPEPSEGLAFQIGDLFRVDDEFNEEWYWVTRESDDCSGLVPVALVKDAADLDQYAFKPWFFSHLPKQQANDYLLEYGKPSSYLIRPSETTHGDYSLSLRLGDSVTRFRIVKEGRKYVMGGRYYDSVEAIIDHYHRNMIVEGMVLGDPVVKTADYLQMESGVSVPVRNSTSDLDRPGVRRPTVPEMITLREKSAMKNGYLVKKSDHNKKWKEYYFSLKGQEQQFLYYDNERHTRPRGMIDLNYSALYHVHESLHGRDNCFQIIVRAFNEVSTYYLCAPTPEEKDDWLRLLAPLCQNCKSVSRRSATGSLMQERRCLYVTLVDANRLPKNCSRPYCLVSLNDFTVARSRTIDSNTPVWDDDFKLDDLQPDIVSFSVAVINRSKRLKDNHIGQVQVQLNTLPNAREKDVWYELRPRNKGSTCGSIRIKARFEHEVILPEGEYFSLKELITQGQGDLWLVRLLADIVKDRKELCSNVMKIFRSEQNGPVRLVRTLSMHEIRNHGEDVPTLFRGTSIATNTFDEFMRSLSVSYLNMNLRDIIQDVLALRGACEVNPQRLDKNAELTVNIENLLFFAQRLTDSIFASVEQVPEQLRYTFHCLQETVKERWPGNEQARIRVVSAFFFLRLICPAILKPRFFHLVTEQPSDSAQRSLTLIAKCIQNLANLNLFGAKEAYMACVNPFIERYRQRMIEFIDQLSNVPHCSATVTTTVDLDIARELATVHRLCWTHLSQIRKVQEETKSGDLRKLVAVTEMISSREDTYR